MYLIDLEIFPSTYILSQLVDKYLIHISFVPGVLVSTEEHLRGWK